jgi:hypothetical protein
VSEKKVGRLRQRRRAGDQRDQNGQRRADAPPPKAHTTQHRPFRPLQSQKISLLLIGRPGLPPCGLRGPGNPRTGYLTLSTNETALSAGKQRVAAPHEKQARGRAMVPEAAAGKNTPERRLCATAEFKAGPA